MGLMVLSELHHSRVRVKTLRKCVPGAFHLETAVLLFIWLDDVELLP